MTLVERELELGGWVRRFGPMYPHDRKGSELIDHLVAEVRKRPTITVLTGAELVGKSGSFGNYGVSLRIGGEGAGTIEVAVGSIVVATGFDEYRPGDGELGYGIEGVVTLSDFKALVDGSGQGRLAWNGRPVRSVAYVYCVGSRETAGCANQYCSRFCCAATVQTAVAGVRPRPVHPPVPPLPGHADVRQVRAALHGGPRPRVASSSSSTTTSRRRWPPAPTGA